MEQSRLNDNIRAVTLILLSVSASVSFYRFLSQILSFFFAFFLVNELLWAFEVAATWSSFKRVAGSRRLNEPVETRLDHLLPFLPIYVQHFKQFLVRYIFPQPYDIEHIKEKVTVYVNIDIETVLVFFAPLMIMFLFSLCGFGEWNRVFDSRTR